MWAVAWLRLRIRVRVVQRKPNSPTTTATHQDWPPSSRAATTCWRATAATPVASWARSATKGKLRPSPVSRPATSSASGISQRKVRKAIALASSMP